MTDAETSPAGTDWRELIAVILLSVTTILTAWAGFEASKWGGEMSTAFSQASGLRIEAARQEGTANRKTTVQVALYTQWLQADAAGDRRFADYLSARFPEPLTAAFAAWQATEPRTNPRAPSSPFVMPEYRIPELATAAAADAEADRTFADALAFNQRGDNYTLLAVAFAAVLFFAAISGRMKTGRDQWILLGVGLSLFTLATVLLISFPKLV